MSAGDALARLRAVEGCGLEYKPGKIRYEHHTNAADWAFGCDACLALLAQHVERETRKRDAMEAYNPLLSPGPADFIRALPTAYPVAEPVDGFAEHLRDAARTVDSWPEWKKGVLGEPPAGHQKEGKE